MSDGSKSDTSGPIPVGELARRLIQRHPGAAPKVAAPRARAPFPPVIPQYGVVVTGRLKSHGAGSPPHRLGQWSYFVKILTTGGLKTLWGADLKRAIAESETRAKIGSMVGVQSIGYQTVRMPLKAGGASDRAGGNWKEARRTRWRVESVEFFADRARQAREARESRFRGRNTDPRPPARPRANINLELAQAFADRHIHSPHDRERFLEQVKDKLQLSAARNKDHEPPTR